MLIVINPPLSFAFEPLSLAYYALLVSICAHPMLLPILPCAHVFTAISFLDSIQFLTPFECALAMLLIIPVLTSVLLAISARQDTIAIHPVLLPLPIVELLTVWPMVDAD